MNRKIKFRAWDENNRQMSYEIEFRQKPKGINNAILIIQKLGLKLMQFTGLLDKNGKEIYEGDILIDDKKELLEVKWGEAEWLAGKLALNANNFFESKSEYTEVIGNIFETPELLK